MNSTARATRRGTRFERILIAIENLFAAASGLAIASMAVLVVAEVIYRQVGGRSIQWASDLIQHYIMVIAFFLVLATAHRAGTHVSLDLIIGRLPERVQRWFGVGADLIALVFFTVVFWASWERTVEAFTFGDRGESTLPWLLGYSYAFMPLGIGLLLLRIIFQLVTLQPTLAVEGAVGSTSSPDAEPAPDSQTKGKH